MNKIKPGIFISNLARSMKKDFGLDGVHIFIFKNGKVRNAGKIGDLGMELNGIKKWVKRMEGYVPLLRKVKIGLAT